ncbi:MAG: hypothetical protein M1839_008553 [Geoglossum umbratile]|nr:MAG: hypothetical protein M1839_008553 [Geoglossum umbratile]
MPHPVHIQKWPLPREIRNDLHDKVPTVLTYRGAGLVGISSWGFVCPKPGNVPAGMSRRELFKLSLDPAIFERYTRAHSDQSLDDVRGWFKDFLTALHGHIVNHFENGLKTKEGWIKQYFGEDFGRNEWKRCKVEYIFSVPTTWKQPSVIEDFRRIVEKAGFGKSEENRSLTIGPTEAVAAAVYTAKVAAHQYTAGDAILVCDAGGGTTDVSILKVISIKGEVAELRQLTQPRGTDVGSVNIDRAFEEKLIRKGLPKDTAYAMAKGKFQDIKLRFGQPMSDLDDYSLSVPGLDRGVIILPRKEIEEIFDDQLNRIFSLIDDRLEYVRLKEPLERVSHIILSGGLGSSKYVKLRMKSRYGTSERKILTSEKPEVAVCRGLVADRVHRFNHRRSIVPPLCEASYGILVNERFSGRAHIGQHSIQDPISGKMLAMDQIRWLIRKGDDVSTDEPVKHTFSRTADPENLDNVWRHEIVTSGFGKDHLPKTKSDGDGDARMVCEIESSLDSHAIALGMKSGVVVEKRAAKSFQFNSLFIPRKAYLEINYEIRVWVRQMDIQFEVWFDGRELGRGVVWLKLTDDQTHCEDGQNWSGSVPNGIAEMAAQGENTGSWERNNLWFH